MKAVEYRYDCWPDGAWQQMLAIWPLNSKIRHLLEGERLSVRFTNGQLCTFKRKEKK